MPYTPAFLPICILAAAVATGENRAPTFQDLMDPVVFPEPQYGMRVESAGLDGSVLRIVTTGAELTLDTTTGKAVFRQRIGHQREVVTVELEGRLTKAPELTHDGPGLAFARFKSPRFDLRANGDSLFMFHAHEPITFTVKRGIDIGFAASHSAYHVLLDEWGGFALYCSEADLDDAFERFGPTTATYALPADAVLWVGVCPPKPYDWDRSSRDHVVWHWSRQTGYPHDEDLAAWADWGNTVLLQSEMMLWKDWNLAFEPRLGEAEFARVRKTIHDNGMRFIVYTSPCYFFKGTPFEVHAMNSFENFKGWPPCRGIGDNIDLFMAEITKVMTEYKPDGLYFDGQYFNSPAALYALARRSRALLGDDGILEWHSTSALGHGFCSLPHADAYVDFILRGEGRDATYQDFDYLRYFVSCYNVSNSIGVLCNNGPRPTAELIQRLLEANCRMHTIASWLADPDVVNLLESEYRPRLTPALRVEVERRVDARQKLVMERAKRLAEEHQALMAPPVWTKVVLIETFDTLPDWDRHVSPQNDTPFAAEDGGLAVTAKAHTYAFLARKLDQRTTGFALKLRQHNDGGMSWGPAACLRLKSGAFIRIGLRSDGCLQADINGEQRLADTHDPENWVWLRARWLGHSGVIERSDDGSNFRRIWTFDHGGAMIDVADSISIGKVPYNGEPIDYKEAGPTGTCYFDELVVY